MHSIREMCGTEDVAHGVGLLQAYLAEFAQLDAATTTD
jgi:aspartyl aminopeptidase